MLCINLLSTGMHLAAEETKPFYESSSAGQLDMAVSDDGNWQKLPRPTTEFSID